MGRRSRPEIIGEMLEAAAEGATKTSIAYRINLGFGLAQKYLNDLLDRGLLTLERGSPLKYKLTDDGIEILKKWRDLKRMLV